MESYNSIIDLKALLSKHYDDANLQILKYEAKLLTSPGENYGSVMLAVNATIKRSNSNKLDEQKHFVAKLCPENDFLAAAFNIQNSFKKELHMYLIGIPTIKQLEDEYGITEENRVSNLFPQCFGGRINIDPKSDTVDKNSAVILLENLNTLGYEMGDRLTGFDLAHTELVVRNLARFHAVPIALRILKPDIFETNLLPCLKYVEKNNAVHMVMVDSTVNTYRDFFTRIPELKMYWDKISIILRESLVKQTLKRSELGIFASINHHDFWLNNTMILRNPKSGEPIHVKIIDFQFQTYNSCLFDLIFFLYTSVHSTLIEDEEKIDHLIALYYKSFIECLTQFRIDTGPYSWAAFQTELQTIAPIELGHVIFMLKHILAERGQIQDMSNLDDSRILDMTHISHESKSKHIHTVLSFIKRKWI